MRGGGWRLGKVRTAKRYVDDAVGAADASLHPHGEGRKEDGDDAEADVGAAHAGSMVSWWLVVVM